MMLTGPVPPPASAPVVLGDTPPATPDPKPGELQEQFTAIAAKLTASDETLTKMVADRSPVGTGWAPHLRAVATSLQAARDAFIGAKPDATELAAKLGADVIKLAEASGSMSIMARQRATLSEGWSSFLDTAIADANAAAELLAPTEPKQPGGPVDPPGDTK